MRAELREIESHPPTCVEPVAPRTASRQRALCRTGLANLGNSCFVNAVLQALAHCTPFRVYFRDFLKAEAPVSLGATTIHKEDTPHLKARAEGAPVAPLDAKLCRAVHALLRVMWSGEYSTISPHEFVQTVWAASGGERFASLRQHDAQEFLTFVISSISDELGQTNHVMRELFDVELLHETICDSCGHVVYTPEHSYGLPLPMPDTTTPKGKLKLESCIEAYLSTQKLVGVNMYHCESCGGDREATRKCSITSAPQALVMQLNRSRYSPSRGLYKDGRHVSVPRMLRLPIITDGVVRRLSLGHTDQCIAPENNIGGNSGATVGSHSRVMRLFTLDSQAIEKEDVSRNTKDSRTIDASPLDTAGLISNRPVASQLDHPVETQSTPPHSSVLLSSNNLKLPPQSVGDGISASCGRSRSASDNGRGGDPSVSDTCATYKLVAIVCHTGKSTHQGHYFTYARSGTGSFALFNDAQVSTATPHHVAVAQAYIAVYERVGADQVAAESVSEVLERYSFVEFILSCNMRNILLGFAFLVAGASIYIARPTEFSFEHLTLNTVLV